MRKAAEASDETKDARLSGNLLGLDYGDRTVGVAFCADGTSVVVGVETIRRERPTKLRRTISRIAELCAERNVDGIILGYPYLMDGTEGERCQKTRIFREALMKRLSLPVVLWDERLTSVAAEEEMTAAGISFEEQKSRVDEFAAMLILQDYVNATIGIS